MSEKALKILLTSLGVLLCLGLSLFPLLWIGLVSFSGSVEALLGGELDLTLKNYADLLREESLHFTDYLRNSLIVSSLSALIALILSLLLSYPLSRFGFRHSTLVLLSVLAVSLLPQVSVVGFLYRLFSEIGLINTYTALVLPYTAWGLPLGVWLLYTYLSSIPKDIERSALVDGAGRLRILLQIMVPLSLPGIVSAYVLLFLFSFNEFLFALMFTIDHRARTVPVGIALFEGLHGQVPWGHITAASLMSVAPTALMVLLLQKYIIRGLTGGAVKG